MERTCIALLIITILSLSGCGGEDSKGYVVERGSHNTPDTPIDTKQPDPKPISSVSEAIDRLVAEGKYPKLNRDADVAGPDVDGNGVRDDLDAYVASLPDKEEQKKAMLQGFASLQKKIKTNLNDENDISNTIKASSLAIDCLFEKYGDDAIEKNKDMMAFTFNTSERWRAYMKYDKEMVGRIFGGGDYSEEPCL